MLSAATDLWTLGQSVLQHLFRSESLSCLWRLFGWPLGLESPWLGLLLVVVVENVVGDWTFVGVHSFVVPRIAADVPPGTLVESHKSDSPPLKKKHSVFPTCGRWEAVHITSEMGFENVY